MTKVENNEIIDTLNKRVKALEEDNLKLIAMLADKDNQLATLREQNKALEEEIEYLLESRKDALDEVSSFRYINQALKEENESLVDNVVKTKSTISQLKSTIALIETNSKSAANLADFVNKIINEILSYTFSTIVTINLSDYTKEVLELVKKQIQYFLKEDKQNH